MKRTDETQKHLLAAEYALGLLRGPARARFERLRREDARYCLPVDEWERALGALVNGLPTEPPPAGLWARVADRIGKGEGR